MSFRSFTLGLARLLVLLMALGVITFVLSGLVASYSKYYFYGRFNDANDRSLYMAAASFWDENFGLIGIANGQRNVDIVFEPEEWDRFVALWRKADSFHQTNPTFVGALSETDASNARIFLIAGPKVQFVLREGDDCVIFELPRSDGQIFDLALMRVKDHLAGKITAAGHSEGPGGGFRDAVEALQHWPPAPPDKPQC